MSTEIEQTMAKKINVSQITKFLGFFLTFIALIFVGKSVWSQREFFLSINIRTTLPIILIGSLAYLIANIILATAWKMLLNWFGDVRLGFLTSITIYGKSQILKYIPGNVFYLPGRHLLSLQHEAEHGPLIGAATFEIIGLLATASGISIFGLLFAKGENTPLSLFVAFTILLAALTSPFILKYILSYDIVLRKMPIFKTMNWGKYPHPIAIWLLYVCFFTLTGFILFWTVTATVGRWNAISLYTALFASAISWLLGTITPGAPAGLGIRESIIILILSSYLGEPTSILISLIMRIITMLSDVVFYFSSLYLEKIFSIWIK